MLNGDYVGGVYDNLLKMFQAAISARSGNLEAAAQDVRDEIDRMPEAERNTYDKEFAKVTSPVPPGFREDGDPQ